MTVHRHPDWYTVVREHWHRTTGFLLASREPCLRIRDEELAAVQGNRALVAFDVDDLAAWKLPESWILGVILCPGDSTTALAAWAKGVRADADRVWFYLHEDTDPEVLRPWQAAGFPTHNVDVVSSWQGLHKLFGLALNDRGYADRARGAP